MGRRIRLSRMARSSSSCSSMRIIPTSLLKSNLSRKWYGFFHLRVGVCEWTGTDGASFIQMCMLRGTCVLIFCRIGGRPLTTWPLSSHRTSSFPSHFLSFDSPPVTPPFGLPRPYTLTIPSMHSLLLDFFKSFFCVGFQCLWGREHS